MAYSMSRVVIEWVRPNPRRSATPIGARNIPNNSTLVDQRASNPTLRATTAVSITSQTKTTTGFRGGFANIIFYAPSGLPSRAGARWNASDGNGDGTLASVDTIFREQRLRNRSSSAFFIALVLATVLR